MLKDGTSADQGHKVQEIVTARMPSAAEVELLKAPPGVPLGA